MVKNMIYFLISQIFSQDFIVPDTRFSILNLNLNHNLSLNLLHYLMVPAIVIQRFYLLKFCLSVLKKG